MLISLIFDIIVAVRVIEMNTFMLILCVIIIVGILSIVFVAIYNHFQDYIIRINEAEVNIDATLRKRYDLVNKAASIIEANLENEVKIQELVNELKSKKLTNFELDRNLYSAINEFHVIKEKYPELQTNEEFIKIELSIAESESEIVGLRKYYNDIITDYNKIVKTFPSNIIAGFNRYKAKDYFDGNNVDQKKGAIKL